MSTKKTTAATSPTKNTPNESTAKTGTKGSDTNAPKGDTTNSDKASSKSDTTPKSASQMSLSHFSSVSTPEYRAGWQRIFGNKKETKEQKLNTQNEPSLNIEIKDPDINAKLRVMLYDILLNESEKQNLDIDKIKKSTSIKYVLKCEIK
jgi:hypothetical protein